ncbi:hypothetical protein GGR53DRAFT_463158 [Hypoxylon sp. FL1150]|nr:hypothetical protein GGR53DRAFT_463158 [Hypoxylon sp. FL1150]
MEPDGAAEPVLLLTRPSSAGEYILANDVHIAHWPSWRLPSRRKYLLAYGKPSPDGQQAMVSTAPSCRWDYPNLGGGCSGHDGRLSYLRSSFIAVIVFCSRQPTSSVARLCLFIVDGCGLAACHSCGLDIGDDVVATTPMNKVADPPLAPRPSPLAIGGGLLPLLLFLQCFARYESLRASWSLYLKSMAREHFYRGGLVLQDCLLAVDSDVGPATYWPSSSSSLWAFTGPP